MEEKRSQSNRKEIKSIKEFGVNHYLCKECQKENRVFNPRKITPIGRMFNSALMRARKFNILFTINKSDIIIPEFCPVLGIKLEFGIGKKHDNSPSLDRIDNNKGYTKDNIMVISCRANQIKNCGTAEEHEKIVNYMRKNISLNINYLC